MSLALILRQARIRIRVLRYLARRGVIDDTRELSVVDADFAERQPALALRGEPGVAVVSGLSVAELGFSLHAATVARADDEAGREVLVRYVLRGPIAQERVKVLPDALVRLELRRAFRDGVAIDMDAVSLLCRLAAAVPPAKMQLTK
jgi:hypothetical protein